VSWDEWKRKLAEQRASHVRLPPVGQHVLGRQPPQEENVQLLQQSRGAEMQGEMQPVQAEHRPSSCAIDNPEHTPFAAALASIPHDLKYN